MAAPDWSNTTEKLLNAPNREKSTKGGPEGVPTPNIQSGLPPPPLVFGVTTPSHGSQLKVEEKFVRLWKNPDYKL